MRASMSFFLLLLIFLGSGCSQITNINTFEEKYESFSPISQNMVHLNDGTPNEVRLFFEQKIVEKDGGLHTYDFEGKTYFMLLEPNRAIRVFHEHHDHVRVITRDSIEAPGSFDSVNEIVSVLYIPFIESKNKPFGIFREEDLVE